MSDTPANFLQSNILLLQQYHPELLALASAEQTMTGFSLIADRAGKPNLQAVHPSTGEEKLVHDPLHAAAGFSELVTLLEQEQQSLIFLTGLGLGYEAEFLIQKFPAFRFVILEPNTEIFSAALKTMDLSFLITNPNVALLVGKDINIRQLLQQEDDALRALPMHLVSQQKLQELFPDLYQPLYSNLQAELLNFKGKLQTIVKQGSLLFKNTMANVPRLPESVNVHSLKNLCQGLPAVCVAAGPSLTKNIALLKGKENCIFIIAVDTAAKILIDHGISPHIIVTIDPIPASMTKLRDVIDGHSDIALAWTPEAFPQTVQGFQNGPKFVIPGINDLFRIYLAPLFAGETTSFPHMLSVTHTATHLAKEAGCNPLIYIGLDLALSGKQDHAEGSPVSWNNLPSVQKIKIPAWDGGEVETVGVLQNQLLALGNIIRQSNDMHFIDATEGGALIPGTEVMPLQKALEQYADKQMAFSMVVDSVFQEAAKPSKESAAATLRELQKQVKASQKTALDGLKNGKEANNLWKLSKIPNKRSQALKKFKKTVVASGNAFDRLMDLLELTNVLYPLRAAAHHEFIYARKKFNETAQDKIPEQRVLEELEQNIDYFKSWLETTKTAEAIISPVVKELAASGIKGK